MEVRKPYVGNHNAKFVVLKGINQNNFFYTTNKRGQDPRLMDSGEIAYDILAYTMTETEAQAIWRENIPKFLLVDAA